MLKSLKLKLFGPNVRDAACRRQPNGTAGGGFMAASGDDSSMMDYVASCWECQWINQRAVNPCGRRYGKRVSDIVKRAILSEADVCLSQRRVEANKHVTTRYLFSDLICPL